MTEAPRSLSARALWLSAPRTVELRTEEVPPPGDGQVRIHAIASALSHGTERLVYRGEAPHDLPLDLPTLSGSFAFPIKYGYASVGRVIDRGPGVSEWAPGDLVFVHHPHQDVYLAPAGMPVRLPAGIDPLSGLFTANMETAVNVVLDTPLRLGETAIVFGQGTVGLLITHLLKRAGAGRVVAVDPFSRRRAAALALGADAALAPDEEPANRARALNRGRGADVAVEASGSVEALQAAIDAVADEGTVVVVSWYGIKPITLALGGRFHRGRVRMRSSQVGAIDPALAPRWDQARRLAVAIDLLGDVDPATLITHRLPLDRATEAFRLLDAQPEEVGQIVLTYDEA